MSRFVARWRRLGGREICTSPACCREDRILEAFGEARWLWQGWIYTPAVTVWVFLSQCLSADHSCREAVARLIAWRLARGLKACSAETGAYCTARDDLPEEACSQLVRETGRQVDDEAPPEWRWLGHRVLDVDGSTFTMPDTPENQAEYPQMASQRRGCGFPIARIVVVFSLAVGTVLDAAIGKYQGKQTGENSLFRTLHDVLRERRRGAGRPLFQRLVRSGAAPTARRATSWFASINCGPPTFAPASDWDPDDHLVCWSKPARPKWMSKEQYAALARRADAARGARASSQQKGFRTQELVVVTTLARCRAISGRRRSPQLYRRRWQAELNLRSLKIVLQMDHLRCKTPHRVRNEFYMHLVAYNLIRQVMAVAALAAGVEPWTVSFKGTLQTLANLLPLLEHAASRPTAWCEALLDAIATHVVGNRPDRFEPRVKKRRPKHYKLMRRTTRKLQKTCRINNLQKFKCHSFLTPFSYLSLIERLAVYQPLLDFSKLSLPFRITFFPNGWICAIYVDK